MRSRADGTQPQHRATQRLAAGRFERQEFDAHEAWTTPTFVGLDATHANPFLA